MVLQDLDGYGSHLPVLSILHTEVEFRNVLEYGGGDYSTKFFNSCGAVVTTVESQDIEWYGKIAKSGWSDAVWMPDHEKVVSIAKSTKIKYDIIMIDTHQDIRARLVAAHVDNTDIIVMHDTETALYQADKVEIEGWYYADFVLHRPWTGVWVKDEKLLDMLCKQIPSMRYDTMEHKIYLKQF